MARLAPLMIVAAILLALASGSLYMLGRSRGLDDEPDRVVAGLEIPPFSLVDQNGREVSEVIFDGHVTIMDFIFTDCPFVCPGMAVAMSDLSERLRGTGVRFVSISVNPARDDPARLRDYAKGLGADLSRWSFLTGDEATIHGLTREGLKFELQQDPTRAIGLPDGSQMDNIVHPSQLILIGPDRRVHGLFMFSEPSQIDALAGRARAMAAGAGSGLPFVGLVGAVALAIAGIWAWVHGRLGRATAAT